MHKLFYKIKFYLERDFQALQNDLEYKKILLKEICDLCRKNCKHKWVLDWIDINPDRTERIIYCEHCELLKNDKILC